MARRKIAHVDVRFVLHRPRSSQNIGAAARALANTGAGALWVVEPLGFDRTQAARLAAGADQVLERMRVVRTLDEAIDDCVEVIMTSGRGLPGAIDASARWTNCSSRCGGRGRPGAKWRCFSPPWTSSREARGESGGRGGGRRRRGWLGGSGAFLLPLVLGAQSVGDHLLQSVLLRTG